MLSDKTAPEAELRSRFRSAQPFPHLVLDRFLDDAACRRLDEQFPRAGRDSEAGDYGTVGRKIVHAALPTLGGAYAEFDALMRSAGFLGYLSRITGIPELLYDPDYTGGGTHENLEGQDLDPHIDFNLHPRTGWHRRLNLILFLNREWEEGWGGLIEFHRDPWRPEENRIERVMPLYNRAVVFETSERSWHGFERIWLPASRRGLSRRSIAVYFYTRTRPAEETAGEHATVYVQRPLPSHIAPGHTLTEADVDRLRELVARRDQQIRGLYQREAELLAAVRHMSGSLTERVVRKIRAIRSPRGERS